MLNLLQEIESQPKVDPSDFIKNIISNLTHEIRTPLNGMLGFSNLLLSNSLDNQKKTDYLKYFNFSGIEITNIFDNLIDLNSLESGNYKTNLSKFSLHLIFSKIYDKIEKKYPLQKVNIKLAVRENCNKYIISDQKLIIEIFKHLIDNALKYSSFKDIQFGCYKEGEEMVFFVKDEGIGIPELNNKYLLYKKFYQLHMGPSRSHNGLGIGLTIAKK
ncbi:MAG: sensor histidine kinase, partial [Bacteroidota bacterium]